jgi:hypothetical protein
LQKLFVYYCIHIPIMVSTHSWCSVEKWNGYREKRKKIYRKSNTYYINMYYIIYILQNIDSASSNSLPTFTI